GKLYTATLHQSQGYFSSHPNTSGLGLHCSELACQQSGDASVPRQGGSAGKGTALKNNSDADLVLFLSCFSSYQDQAENRASVLDTIEKQLNRCRETIAYQLDVAISQPKEKGTCPRSLSITIQSKKRRESIEVDVLPAYDALGPVTPGTRPSPRVYEELIQASTSAGEFCTSFTELQRNFVKRRPAKLKNLLRLVKHWYKELSKKASGLPPKYALELLTIYAWENGTQQAEKFITAEGFHTVMKLLCQYRELCIFWTEFYDLQHPPIIPDPTGILGQGKKWDLLAKEAANCQAQMFCKTGLTPIRSWNVQPARPVQVMVMQLSGVSQALPPLSPYITIWEIKEKIELAWHISPYTQRLPQEMGVFVKDQNGRTGPPYTVHPNDTVLDLKKKIEVHTGVAVNQQRLTFNSQELQDNGTLSQYHIRHHSTIYLLLRLRGG
uniref:Ubiquitin-like domain-containing protein n=1 Tax=Pelusios castaneus TaxID=367368 RepID=A0A8C8SIR7_9SAUR